MKTEDIKDWIATLTPATPEQLADCHTGAEMLLVGTLALRGMCSEYIDEIVRDHRRLVERLK